MSLFTSTPTTLILLLEKRIKLDLEELWSYKGISKIDVENRLKNIFIYKNYFDAIQKTHAITILTEWDEFKTYDWKSVFKVVTKPAFIFDGRNILDSNYLKKIGFNFYNLGK